MSLISLFRNLFRKQRVERDLDAEVRAFVDMFNPLAYGVVVTFLMTVALAASYVPARRALKVDPVGAIRAE